MTQRVFFHSNFIYIYTYVCIYIYLFESRAKHWQCKLIWKITELFWKSSQFWTLQDKYCRVACFAHVYVGFNLLHTCHGRCRKNNISTNMSVFKDLLQISKPVPSLLFPLQLEKKENQNLTQGSLSLSTHEHVR